MDINVHIGLTDETVKALRDIITSAMATIKSPAPLEKSVSTSTPSESVKADKPAPAPVPAPKHTAPVVQSAPKAIVSDPAPVEDLPADDAVTYTNADLMDQVKIAKARVGAEAIRAIFTKFGISKSTDCPEDRRCELVKALENA